VIFSRRIAVLLFSFVACSGDDDAPDAGVPDAGAELDSGSSGTDAGDDTGTDAGTDAGAEERDGGVVDPGDWTAIVATRATATMTVGGDEIEVRGSGEQWLPIVAVTDTPDAVSWTAGVAFSGEIPADGPGVRSYRVAVDPDTREVYVAFTVHAAEGSDPMTIELTGPDGEVGATTTTFADASGVDALYQESFLAKLDADGAPQWVKRLAQGSGDRECTSAQTYALNAEGEDVMVMIGTANLTDRESGETSTLTLGPGDPGETSYDVPTNQRINVTMLLDTESGELQHLDVLGDRTTNFGGVNAGWNFPTAPMLHDEVGLRYAAAGGISNFVVTDVAFSLEDSPVDVPQPGPVGYRAIWGTLADDDLAVEFVQAAAGNTASDVATFTYPLADGQVLVAANLASTTDATFSSSDGPRVFTGGEDATGWLALYDADAEVVWAKQVLAGASEGVLVWSSAVDDPEDDAVFTLGPLIRSGAVTLGPSEDGEVVFEDLASASSHAVLARFDRGTGDLVWARLFEQVSSGPAVNLHGLLYRGADDTLEVRYAASGEVEVAGSAEDLGSGVSWVRAVFDEDGTRVSHDVMLHPTEDAGVAAMAADLRPR